MFKRGLIRLIAELVLHNAKFQEIFESYLHIFYPGHLHYHRTLVFLNAR